ncbi:capsid protein [red clover-associated luteovirus]|nr:capsid protein [red clover-associated luteovirus]AVX32315.1 capsid protein [red clover-associated luteovirus]AVX32320.1 capsid protein [red clover-associated luteovirus]
MVARNANRGRRAGRTSRRISQVLMPVRTVAMKNGNKRNAGQGLSAGKAHSEVFRFTIDDLKGNTSGCYKFCKDLTQYKPISEGIIKAFHEYRVTKLNVQYRSFASAQTTGSLAIEIDTSCTVTSLGSKIESFPIKSSASKSFSSGALHGTNWVNSLQNQFHLLISGNGGSEVAGQIVVTATIQFQNPK